MSLEFLSGLALVLLVLGTIAYMAKELLEDRHGGSASERRTPSGPKRRKLQAKPVNEHLIGAPGDVVACSDDDERPMRVRLGPELWPARASPGEETSFPVGTRVEVTAVQGPVVLVRRSEQTVS